VLRANDGALCIAAICAALSIGRDSTRAELRRMERAGLVAIDDVGRQKATVGYSDGALVERQATRRGRSRSAMALCGAWPLQLGPKRPPRKHRSQSAPAAAKVTPRKVQPTNDKKAETPASTTQTGCVRAARVAAWWMKAHRPTLNARGDTGRLKLAVKGAHFCRSSS